MTNLSSPQGSSSSYDSSPSQDSSPAASPAAPSSQLPPQLPHYVDYWSTRALAEWLEVSVSTVKYHARQAFRGHAGRYDLDREQAQKVVNRIYQFGQKRSRKARVKAALVKAPSAPASPQLSKGNILPSGGNALSRDTAPGASGTLTSTPSASTRSRPVTKLARSLSQKI
jgi:hypothetical protein